MWTRRDSRAVAAVLAVLALLAVPAGAGTFDPYVVRGFTAEAVAASGAEAKEAAIAAAVAEGFAVVVGRVASRQAAERLASPDKAMGFLDFLSIGTERVGPAAYRASIDLHYSQIAVRGYLQRSGVEVVDEPAPPVLLIPVLVEGGIPLAWERAAAWTAALEAVDFTAGMTPVALPRNSREDKREQLARLMDGDRVSLDTFRVRYRVHGVVVAVAETVAGRERVSVRLAGEDGAAPIAEAMEVETGGLEAAAKALARLLSERWKANAGGTLMVSTGTGAALPVRVLLQGGDGEWEGIRDRLQASGAVSGVSVESAGGTAMNVLLWHDGEPGALAARLSAEGLDLFEAGGGWLLQSY